MVFEEHLSVVTYLRPVLWTVPVESTGDGSLVAVVANAGVEEYSVSA